MQKPKDSETTRLTIGDLIAGGRILLLPIALVGGLVAAARMFHDTSRVVEGASTADSWFSSIPHEAWIWVLIGYLAIILPRQPLALRVPGIPRLVKGLILSFAGGCFWLELRYHNSFASFLEPALMCGIAASCVVAAAFVVRAERARYKEAEESRDQMLERMILEYERQNSQAASDPSLSHPALFAKVDSIVKSRSAFGTRIWFLRPHPALNHRRPIDVLREPNGEDKLLQACKMGPNI